jgi:peroxiredoxin
MAARELKVGQKAPDFELEAAGSDPVRLKDLRGKWVVLFFYPKASTSGCTKEAQAFRDAKGKFTRKAAVILGISRDRVKANTNFREKHKLNMPLLCDPDKAVHEKYGVMVEKKMYGKTVMGVDRSTFLVDPEGALRQIWRSVKVPGHVDDVFDALKTIQAG